MKILIKILIKSENIHHIYRTLKSIQNQTMINDFDVSVNLCSSAEIQLKTIEAYAKDLGFKLGELEDNCDFLLEIKSGSIISRSFIYMATEYLNKNPDLALAFPAYTLQFTEDEEKALGIENSQISPDLLDTSMYKIGRELSLQSISKGAVVNTYSIKSPYTDSIHKLHKNIPESIVSIENKYILDLLRKNTSSLDSHTIDRREKIKSPRLRKVKDLGMNFLNTLAKKSRFLRKLRNIIVKVYWHLFTRTDIDVPPFYLSGRLCQELDDLKNINYEIYGYDKINYLNITELMTVHGHPTRSAFYEVYDYLKNSDFEYVMVLPWLIKGGVDLFAINYANTLNKLGFKGKVLIITTCHGQTILSNSELNLDTQVKVLNIAEIWKFDVKYNKKASDLLYALLLLIKPKYLHIMMSEIGYQCLDLYGETIRRLNTKIIFSSYNYLEDKNGRRLGYSVKQLPNTYRIGDTITTDNQLSKDIWVNNFGLRKSDIAVHRQLLGSTKIKFREHTGINIVWASHVRKEKNPETIIRIAKRISELSDANIKFHCYGAHNPHDWEDGKNPFLETRLKNLFYHGAFLDFKKDLNLEECDLFIYTSSYDGMPNMILEIAKCGIPIISSNVSGMKEIPENLITVVQDSMDVEKYCEYILKYMSSKELFSKRARELKLFLDEQFSEENFTKQTRRMLK